MRYKNIFLALAMASVTVGAAFGAASVRTPQRSGDAVALDPTGTTSARAGTLRAKSTSTARPLATTSVAQPATSEITNPRLSFLSSKVSKLNVKNTDTAKQELKDIDARIEQLQSKLDSAEALQSNVLSDANIDERIEARLPDVYSKREIDELLSEITGQIPQMDKFGNIRMSDASGNAIVLSPYSLSYTGEYYGGLLQYGGYELRRPQNFGTTDWREQAQELTRDWVHEICAKYQSEENLIRCDAWGYQGNGGTTMDDFTVLRCYRGFHQVLMHPGAESTDYEYVTFEDISQAQARNRFCGSLSEEECSISNYSTSDWGVCVAKSFTISLANAASTPSNNNTVYEVRLSPDGGREGSVTSLWEVYSNAWYIDPTLTTPVITLSGTQLPTREGYNFVGYYDGVGASSAVMGIYNNGTWTIPSNTAITSDTTWYARWESCALAQYYANGSCQDCPTGYTAGPNPQSINDCYTTCIDICEPVGCQAGVNGVLSCNYIDTQYSGVMYYGSTQCLLEGQPTPNCAYTVTCEPGYYPINNNTECAQESGSTITLDSNLGGLNGTNSTPSVLYTLHNTGVYLNYTHTMPMTPESNPITMLPEKYAVVTFDGNGATINVPNKNVDFTFNGFYNTTNGTSQYIGPDGYITVMGDATGKSYAHDATWYAQWTANAIGELPIPTRPGYLLTGWYTEPVGGSPVSTGTLVTDDMTLYARWSPNVYSVVLNANGGTNGTVTSLAEQYGVAWYLGSAVTNAVTQLSGVQLPTREGYNFAGYYDGVGASSAVMGIYNNGTWTIPSNTAITSDTTWYARWESCALAQYYANGSCQDCPAGYTAAPDAQSINDCYKACTDSCSQAGCQAGVNGVLSCNYIDTQYSGVMYYGSTQCELPDGQPAPYCEYTVTCDTGYYPNYNGTACEPESGFAIMLNSNLGGLHGTASTPSVLYTLHNTGVYLDSNHTIPMDELTTVPIKYATVTFDGNGTTINEPNRNVSFTFNGFYNSSNGVEQYITSGGQITLYGINAGRGYTENTIWYANWTANAIGELPIPTRPGYLLTGWYTEPVGGSPVSTGTLVTDDMILYARWSANIYHAFLDANGGMSGTVTSLAEWYNTGWYVDPALTSTVTTLSGTQLPTREGYQFAGYYDSSNVQIGTYSNGTWTLPSPTAITSEVTWYARWEAIAIP